MTITVYANYQAEQIISEKEYQKMVDERVNESLKDRDSFNEYCVCQDIDPADIWFLSEVERAKTAKDYEEWLKFAIENELEYDWKMTDIDIPVRQAESQEVWTVDFAVNKTQGDDYHYLMELEDRVFATKDLALDFFFSEMKRMNCTDVELDDKDELGGWYTYTFKNHYKNIHHKPVTDECWAIIQCKEIVYR